MNIRTLWYFLSAATSGGMSAGARRLGIAQSTLSGVVDALQAELRGPLFENTPIGLRPTPAAIRLRDYAFSLISEAEQAFLDLQAGSLSAIEPVPVFTYGIPRCSKAEWAALSSVFASVSQGGPRAALVSSGKPEPDANIQDGIIVRYRLVETGVPVMNSMQVLDTWTLLGINRIADIDATAAWGDLANLRLIGPPLLREMEEALGPTSPVKIDLATMHPAGVPFSLLDRKDAALLVPTSALPQGFASAGLRSFPVTGAPILPAIEVMAAGGGATGKGHLARTLVDHFRKTLEKGEESAPRMRSLESRVDVHTLRCFRATMETGNTSRAAHDCFIVQPALSGQLRKLEKALSRQLFTRSHAGMNPTSAGRRLHSLIEPLLNDHSTALDRLREGLGSRQDRGRVRLGIVPAASEESLIAEAAGTAIAEWRVQFPDTAISVAEGYTSVLLRWLRTHLIDLAIIDSTRSQPGLQLLPIFSERMTLVFAPGSVWDTGQEEIEGHALASRQLVIPSKRFGLRELFDRAFAEAGVTISPGLEVDSLAIALRLVASGHWATMLPPSAVHRQLGRGSLKQRLLVTPHIERRICAALRSQSQLPPEAADLLQRLDNAFRAPTTSASLVWEVDQPVY